MPVVLLSEVVTGPGGGGLHPPGLLLPDVLPAQTVPPVLQDNLPPHCPHHTTPRTGQSFFVPIFVLFGPFGGFGGLCNPL